jgi:hypothetical protein
MVYEARNAKSLNYMLIGGCLFLSLIGFAAAGIIPTASGTSPLVGWAIVAACLAAAIVFFRRAADDQPQARVDAAGIWSRRFGEIAWDRIGSFYVLRAGIQRIARFELRDPARTVGINTTFYDRGIDDLVTAVKQHRPDLAP